MYNKLVKYIFLRILVPTLLYSFTISNVAIAQGSGLSILRDAEIEQIIRNITEPIFIAAELDKNAVNTYLLNDNAINAFVMGGQNIFLNSGLLLKATNVNQVIGVVAHETGHITGGHLSRFSEGLEKLSTYSLLGAVLGAAAMAAGSVDAGMALMMGGQHIGYRKLLGFSRTQESAADQAGLSILEKTGQSGQGLIDFFEILGDQDLVPERYRDPYASTHPITSQRIERVRDRVQASPYYKAETDPQLEKQFLRLQAKLFGYLKPLYATLVRYPISDQSVNARYARTFGYQQNDRIKEALIEINRLILEYPENPFYYEAKAQILFEDGRVLEALQPYGKAVEYLPSSALLRMSYARALISSEDDQFLDNAIKNLEIALDADPDDSFGWKQASIAYHRMNNNGMTYYSTAQHFLLSGNIRGAMVNAKKALDILPKGSPNWIKSQDIMVVTESHLSDDEKKRRKKNKKENREIRQKERQRGLI
ncbi:MAG: M48 family metalloprotease [Kordiimonadaceae bacterium]|nr:M48 family metalloprotease [Kordiimonadaceae bacterium]